MKTGLRFLFAMALVAGGCANGESSSSTDEPTAQEPTAQEPTTQSNEFIIAFPASDPKECGPTESCRRTTPPILVASWELYRSPATDALIVVGSDALGENSINIEVRRDAEQTVIAVGSEVAVVGPEGVAETEGLSEGAQAVLEHMSTDFANAEVEYNVFGCIAVSIATLAGAAACGTGNLFACAALPYGFCSTSNYCGNDACGYSATADNEGSR